MCLRCACISKISHDSHSYMENRGTVMQQSQGSRSGCCFPEMYVFCVCWRLVDQLVFPLWTHRDLWVVQQLVPRLSSQHYPPPLMCVHPHKHMLSCVVVLWRTQSTSYHQLSLVAVSGLCGRTGSYRMDCCVIDFNLESAACCFSPPPPPPLLSKPGPCWPPATAYLWGISLIALLQKTHLSKVAEPGVKGLTRCVRGKWRVGGTFFFFCSTHNLSMLLLTLLPLGV